MILHTLGTPVVVTDYLRRIDLRWAGKNWADALANAWPEYADLREKSRVEKVWVPQSIYQKLADARIWLPLDRRNNPSIGSYALTLPAHGIVVAKVTLQDGSPACDPEDGASWKSSRRYAGYRVAYHLSRRPLVVRPDMIEAAS